MMSLLTPCRSEANQAKISLFLLRTSKSSFSSSSERFAPMITFLSRRASSRGIDLVSSSFFKSVYPQGISGGSTGRPSLVSMEFIFLRLGYCLLNVSCFFLSIVDRDDAV